MTEAEWLASLKGTDGADGEDGANGKSAYELYVESVPEGETPMTEVEWLESLNGKDGIGIKNIYFADGEIVIVLDNNTVYKFDVTADEEETPVVPDETPVTPEV